MSVATTEVKDMAETLSFRVDEETAARLEEFRERQRFPPNKSEVCRRALIAFLDEELED